MKKYAKAIIALAAAWAAPAMAEVDYAAQLKEGDAVLRDFTFADGEKLPSLKIHYATLGTPQRDKAGRIENAVMVLHGTGGSGKQFLSPQFAQELYGPGQPLDISRYYIILPDGIGHGAEHVAGDGRILLSSYHCSRYNQNTRRLDAPMFEAVFERALALHSETSL